MNLRLSDVTVSYHRLPAVHHLSHSLDGGTCTGILGPNGAGKTSLLKAIAGLLSLETGTIRFDEANIQQAVRAGRIAYLPQRESIDWDFPITVRGLVEMGRYPQLGIWRRFGEHDYRMVCEALEMMDLTAFANRQIKALSGGQQQRAFLARAWAQQSEVYLLDEPFNGLDCNAQETFTRALHSLRSAGKIILASHHDLQIVPEIFDRVLLLNGELVAAGLTAEVFTPENIRKVFSMKIFTGDSHA